ncbi:MAG: hypothetical protein RIQ71_225 [Verrucomicrobiota bacterium]|jgi:glycosyltransferase involved in cell wall biosynthesis
MKLRDALHSGREPFASCVVINSYNTARFVGDAIESALLQTCPPDQIVVVDGSTDESKCIIEEYASRNAKIKSVFVRNDGQLSSIVTGVAAAAGEIIFLLDGDDRYAPDHIERMEEYWRQFPQADVIYCRHLLSGNPALVDFLKNREKHESADWLGPISLEKPYDWGRSPALAWCHPNYHAGGITASLSFRRKHLQSLPLRELCEATNGQLRANADYMLLLASALYGGRKIYVPDQTVEHRVHAKSITGRHASGDRNSLAEQRSYCAIARSWLCSRPGFGSELFNVLDSEMAAVPQIALGHRRLYQEAKESNPANRSTTRQLQALRSENLQLKTKLDALHNSHSWRVTAPLRYAMRKFHAARRRLFRKGLASLRFEEGTVAIDISTLWHHDAGTGIQRVVRKMAIELTSAARGGKRMVLVDYSSGAPLDVTNAFLGSGKATVPARQITGMEMLIMLDSSYNLAPSFSRRLREAKRDGVFVVSICHDLLPVTNPEWFLAVNHIPFHRWLNLATDYSSAFLCISETTATRLSNHLAAKQRTLSPAVASWPPGYDLDTLAARTADNAATEAERFALMIGTVEPRKNHTFVLEALARLRAEGAHAPKLVVVGRYGWKNNKAKQLLRDTVNAGWAEWHDHGIPDEDLSDLYSRAHCVIQASLDEGFGLPVAEAAAMGKPVVLSDIPVFREIVRENGYFFRLGDAKSFTDALTSACRPDAKPTSTKAVSWQESADIFWRRCLELREADTAWRAT